MARTHAGVETGRLSAPGSLIPKATLTLLGAFLVGETTVKYVDLVVSVVAPGYVLDLNFGYTPVFIGIGLLMPLAAIVGLAL